jgi:hypothetical protein
MDGVCPTCGEDTKFYIEEYCPACDKPEALMEYVLSFQRLCVFLEHHGRAGAKKRLVHYLKLHQAAENSYIRLDFPTDNISDFEDDRDLLKDLLFIMEQFEIEADFCLIHFGA